MSGQIENIPLHILEPGDGITEADLAKLLEATDPLTSAAIAATAAATQGTTVTFHLEDLFVECAYDEEDEDGEDEDEEDEEDEEDDDGVDEIYYNEAMDGWLGPWWASV